MIEYPLNKEEWKWTSGGFTEYHFINKNTNEKIDVKIPEQIMISTSFLYNFIEESDHWNIIKSIEEKYGKNIAEMFGKMIDEIREIISKEWKKKYTGELPHL